MVSSSTGPASIYHVRGTHNKWAEGLLMTRVGTTDVYESCINFVDGDASGGPRFKIDPNGGWGNDSVPAADYVVPKGWAKILFNSTGKTVTATTGLGENCLASYHLRGTQTATPWAEGDMFTPVAGSTNYEICRNFTKGDANGGPRFKVDPNGAWGTDSFPAADVAAEGWTKIVINGKAIVSTLTKLTENCGGAAASSSAAVSSSSVAASSSSTTSSTTSTAADDFRARTMYFMFVDRFANGDKANDVGLNAAGTIPASTVNPNQLTNILDWKKYWGGDIQGMIDKLDYLQSLGVTAIWVTPLVDNVNNTGPEGIYHGYQARDFYEVDEHLGSWELVDKLDAEMEKRNMKLVLDIALNHSNHVKMHEKGSLYKEGKLLLANFDAGKVNETWYHNRGTMTDCGLPEIPKPACDDEWGDLNKVQNKMLFDLADFAHGKTSNSVADEYLIGAAKKWMDHGVDAFRIDAIKHIEPSFINRFTAAMRDDAKAKGRAEPYIFGEWYDAGATDAASMQFLNEGRGSELLDFGLRDNIERAISGNQSMKVLNSHIEVRPSAMKGKDNWQPIFLDNHDAQRTSVYLQTTSKTNRGNGKGMGKTESDARQNLGMALVMTLPGIPVVYYGTEQNEAILNLAAENEQIGSDPFNREMMTSFATTKPAFKLISALAALRQDSVAIQKGSYKQLWVDDDILVFQRQSGTDCAVIAVNRGAQKTINVSGTCLANASYTSKVGSEVVNIAAGGGSFNLPQYGVIALHP
ncbi:MAG TPA: alpha-amylase family glycosyl hydrolase [Cellvibrio sp.]|nr:alpha-amylase family glycosyl hydrolase [Cellvibrio sp.]